MAVQNRKKNTSERKIVRPLDLSVFGENKLTPIGRTIMCAIFSYSLHDFCKFTYQTLYKRYNCSYSSIYRFLHQSVGELDQGKPIRRGDGGKSFYAFSGERRDGLLYFEIEEWLYSARFRLDDKIECLNKIEVEVLSFIRSQGKYITSMRRIAERLGIAESTVSRAIARLERNKLVTVDYRDEIATHVVDPRTFAFRKRAVNHHTKMSFRANEETLARAKRTARRAPSSETEQIEYERYYSGLKQKEEDRILALEDRLGDLYKKIRYEIRSLEVAVVKAEFNGSNEQLSALRERLSLAHRKMREFLEQNGVAEDELRPHYHCPDCHDKGVLPDGTFCDCWKRRRRQ